jgi:hypothetical protein
MSISQELIDQTFEIYSHVVNGYHDKLDAENIEDLYIYAFILVMIGGDRIGKTNYVEKTALSGDSFLLDTMFIFLESLYNSNIIGVASNKDLSLVNPKNQARVINALIPKVHKESFIENEFTYTFNLDNPILDESTAYGFATDRIYPSPIILFFTPIIEDDGSIIKVLATTNTIINISDLDIVATTNIKEIT